MSADQGITRYTSIKTVKFKFAKHCNAKYSQIHHILDNVYSEPFDDVESLFLNPTRTDVAPAVVETIKHTIVAQMAKLATATDDITLIKTLIDPCPLYAKLYDDEDRQPLRNKEHFRLILDDAIASNKKKAIIYISINTLHFDNPEFMPERFETIGTTQQQPHKVALPEVQMTSEQQVQIQVQQLALLKLVAEEVNKTRKSRLNCWERESARTTGSKRSPKFRKKVINYYQRESPSRKSVKCQILDKNVTYEAAEDTIVAAHIWKASTRGKDLEEFGLSDKDVNSARNGLFLTKGIEDAFDNQQVCFLYNKLTTQLFLWVADTKIRKHKIIGSDPRKKFSDVHQKPLCCPNQEAMPFRRLLSWHARLTLELRKESVPVSDYTSEYDHSPSRRGAQLDPIAQAIDEMVDPGDDASVSR